VTLTATPAVGWHFAGWSGDTSGSANPVTLTMTGNRSVTATFAIDTHTLGVATVGSGTVAKSPDQSSYDYGTAVTLTATPAVGWHFVGWSGDTSGSANPVTLTMTGNWSVTATFAIDTHTLNVSTVGSGAVAKSPDQSSYDYGTAVTLTATPAVGWHFVGWSGDTSGSANPLTLTLTGNRSVTATFAIDTYALAVTALGNGAVSRSPDQPTYDHGTLVTLTATPLPGHAFVGWGGDASGSANPLAVTMDQAKSVTAQFTYALVVSTVGSGTVDRNPDLTGYLPGTDVTLTATPATGWSFVSWSGGAGGSTNPVSVAMSGDRNVTATFAVNQYVLTTAVVGSGSIVKQPDQASYTHGTTVSLTAQPATGWHFLGWSGAASGTTQPLELVMTSDLSVTASFAIDTHTLSLTTTGSGAVLKSPDQATYDHGTVVTLTAQAAQYWHLESWGGDATGSANPVVLTMDGDKTVGATFAIDTYPLDVTVDGQGSVTRNPDQASYAHGTNVGLAATPATGWRFTGWTGDVADTASAILITMDQPRTVIANFAILTYALSVTSGGGGSVVRSPDQPTYDHGSLVTLDAVPSTGWHFVGWGGDASGAQDPLMVLMDGDKTVTADFAIDQHPLAVSVSGWGAVQRTPDLALYDHGTLVTLEAIPDSGDTFVGWGGDLAGTANPVQLVMNGSKTATATFADLAPPVAQLLVPNGGESALIGAVLSIQWKAQDNHRVTAVDIELSRNGPAGPFVTLAAGQDPTTGSHAWTVTGPVTAQALVRVIARDSSANADADTSDAAFYIMLGSLAAGDPESFDFALEPIVPNPAHGAVTIEYAVPRETPVSIAVIDLQGRQLASLVHGPQAAGRHRVRWDPGSLGDAAPGTYFIRYQAGGRKIVRRIIFTR
jgi:uncharacterized repeat protein (TIGR02543 family)